MLVDGLGVVDEDVTGVFSVGHVIVGHVIVGHVIVGHVIVGTVGHVGHSVGQVVSRQTGQLLLLLVPAGQTDRTIAYF